MNNGVSDDECFLFGAFGGEETDSYRVQVTGQVLLSAGGLTLSYSVHECRICVLRTGSNEMNQS